MKAIFKRELASYFNSPLGYVILAIFAFLSGLFTLLYYYSTGYSYSIADAIAPMLYFALFIIPPITMRSFTEEKRQHTDQALLTAPVNIMDIVLGKYLSALVVYLACTLFYVVYALFTAVIIPNAAIEWGVLFTCLLGIIFLGAAMLAVNIFYSSLTASQILAVVIGMGTGLFVILYDTLVYALESAINSIFSSDYSAALLPELSITGHYTNFISGVLNPADIVFFLSFVALFLFFTGRVLDRKRWA
ncbi:MAG: ABC transporter permease [Eubacteriales bacterium]|nr:ABC transporter permease [Eubacteriales bacterium]